MDLKKNIFNVIDVDARGLEKDILGYPDLAVISFWSEIDPWCQKFNPILSEVSEEYKGKVRFTKINVLKSAENQNIAIQNGIMVTPTLVFFHAGIIKKIAIGFQKRKCLIHLIDDFIKYN